MPDEMQNQQERRNVSDIETGELLQMMANKAVTLPLAAQLLHQLAQSADETTQSIAAALIASLTDMATITREFVNRQGADEH